MVIMQLGRINSEKRCDENATERIVKEPEKGGECHEAIQMS